MAGSGRGVCASSAAATTSPIDVNPVPNRFCIVSLSMSYKLALCFLRGLPTTASSGRLVPKTLLESVGAAASTSAGGVAPREVLPIEPGDLRELAFRGSAEC
jgi:hypothetical protein